MEIAVFLGPSLALESARVILPANYYPPAKMGDVYRILASGVHTIILIDGLFHQTASIWHRELLAALENGIEVWGASSMGALRAAELAPLGMKGHGQVFQWFREGFLDGDDEVALLHAGKEHDFKAFSEPLVNIRHTLQRAVHCKILVPEQEQVLIHFAKGLNYAQRSYQRLMESDEFQALEPPTQTKLSQFIHQESISLKQQDAIGVLKTCAASLPSLKPVRTSPSSPIALSMKTNTEFHTIGYLERGFYTQTGQCLTGHEILKLAQHDQAEWATLRLQVTKEFFLMAWIKQTAWHYPADFLQQAQELGKHQKTDNERGTWLKENGLTALEANHLFRTKLELQGLKQHFPKHLEPTFHQFQELFAPILKSASEREQTQLQQEVQDICLLNDWATSNGVTCPVSEVEQLKQRKQATGSSQTALFTKWATHDWLLQQGPVYFGYSSWSLPVAILNKLQITGRAARLARNFVKKEAS